MEVSVLPRLGLVLLLIPCARVSAQASSLTGLHGDRAATVFVAPDDPGIRYSSFVHAEVDSHHASFDRAAINWTGNQHSPGTRIEFRTSAREVKLLVDYLQTGVLPGTSTFRVEVDGVLQDTLFGSGSSPGRKTFTLLTNGPTKLRTFSWIMPYGSDVDILGISLGPGAEELASAPPPRPSFTYVAYGDSITHGFAAASTAHGYPYLVAEAMGWDALNMGFTGRIVTGADGAVVGGLGASCISAAIGINDYIGEAFGPTNPLTFQLAYNVFLDGIRSVQPSVPIFVITPIWSMFENTPNTLGLVPEDYRQMIRSVVAARTPTDPQLFLVEGLPLVPPGTAFFFDGVHPNSAGFASYAAGLSAAFKAVLGGEDGARGGRAGDGAAGDPPPGPGDRFAGPSAWSRGAIQRARAILGGPAPAGLPR